MINGPTQGLFLDDPQFAPLLAGAEALGVPLYLHPGVPPAPVREVYYSNLPHGLGQRLGMAGFGWHAETAVPVLRLILSGTLERYPRLRLVIGHMGETLPVMMDRADMTMPAPETHLPRSIAQTLRDQHITTSGIFTRPPLEAALATFGLDNILFSVDYPYAPNKPGHEFLAGLQQTNRTMWARCKFEVCLLFRCRCSPTWRRCRIFVGRIKISATSFSTFWLSV